MKIDWILFIKNNLHAINMINDALRRSAHRVKDNQLYKVVSMLANRPQRPPSIETYNETNTMMNTMISDQCSLFCNAKWKDRNCFPKK